MDSNKKDFSKKSKKLILRISNMIEEILDKYESNGNLNFDNFKLSNQLSQKLSQINIELNNLGHLFKDNNYKLDNLELDNFSIAAYYSLVQTFPLTHQFDQQMLVNILGMLKLVTFIAFEAGKVGLENDLEEKSEGMLKKGGFKEELSKGFNLEEWKKNIESE
jgi:hypothetical protein